MSLDLEHIFATQVQAALTDVIDRLVSEVGRRVSQLELSPNITVSVPPFPQIPTPPPAQITVQPSGVELELEQGEVVAALERIEVALSTLILIMKQPVTKTVTRGENDLIESVTETR